MVQHYDRRSAGKRGERVTQPGALFRTESAEKRALFERIQCNERERAEVDGIVERAGGGHVAVRDES